MNATRFGLLKRDVAEAFQVTDLSDFDTFALLVGRVTLLLFGAFLLFGIASASYRFARKQFKGWLTKDAPPDIPDFLRCTCVSTSIPAWQNTTSGDVQVTTTTSRIPNPKCPLHSHEVTV